MLTSFLPGFALSLTLILAIGAQNAFVLRQGLRREHVFWVCLTCGVTDALLIIAGVAGFGALSTALPWFETLMRYGGAAFLLWYGFLNARSAWRGGAALEVANTGGQSLRATILTGLRSGQGPHRPASCFSLRWAMARGCSARCSPSRSAGASLTRSSR
jgi:L-lysine exporter family protein LysE/ArgO